MPRALPQLPVTSKYFLPPKVNLEQPHVGGGGGGCESGDGNGGGGGGGGRWGAEARSTGSSHCGGQANAGWLAPASLVATLGFVMCGWKAAQKAAATPMKMSAWKLYASFLAYRLR